MRSHTSSSAADAVRLDRVVIRFTYDDATRAQVRQAQEAEPADLERLLTGADAWTVD
ncbi:hypothetical protein [Streptomyces fulvoviolaceus]|uniref:hypothetical protein n=1 Tax=Streptomyces fulvoviolaceus TaxID=285535 RepID=UPI000A726057|nr:hypothetical protein [Streptomyces fulvoviolaceus]